jgi:branched-chain amino acid transport system permease protein
MTDALLGTFLGIDSVREVAQAIVTGIVTGSGYALLGAALALILGVTGRFHFALASTYMLSSFLAAVAAGSWGLPLIPAVLVGLTAAVIAGILIESLVYWPVAKRVGQDALLPIFVASLGIVIAAENVVRLIWGSNTRNLEGFPEHNYTVADVNFSLAQLSQVAAAVILLGGLTLLLRQSVLGQQIRAVRGNAELAPAVGVNVRQIFIVVFVFGTLLAGVAAIFSGVRFAVSPGAGNEPIFYAFVVAFVAGLNRSPLAVGAVGLAIGVAETVSTIWVSQNLSAITVFGLLFIFLAVRSLPPGVRQIAGALSRTGTSARPQRAVGRA